MSLNEENVMSDFNSHVTKKGLLLGELRRLSEVSKEDPLVAHVDADNALLAFIADPEVTAAFNAIKRWYE